jgi:hypothetical protein
MAQLRMLSNISQPMLKRDPSDEEDDKLLAKMKSKDNKERMEGLLHLVYHVRCNRFHGQKHFSER